MAESIQSQILNKVTDISVSVARIEGRMTNVESANAKLMKVVVDGNGKPPLVDRVEDIERQLTKDAENKKESKEKKDKWDVRAWAIVMLFISQIVIVIFK